MSEELRKAGEMPAFRFYVRGKGCGMVSMGEMARIALRYETSMSDAMLRALGIGRPARRAAKPPRLPDRDRYEGLGECFAQRYGTMQGYGG